MAQSSKIDTKTQSDGPDTHLKPLVRTNYPYIAQLKNSWKPILTKNGENYVSCRKTLGQL